LPPLFTSVAALLVSIAVAYAATLFAALACADSETLPLVFPLTVQAPAIGITTTLMLPFLRFSSDGQ
jgi:hypothetical protein